MTKLPINTKDKIIKYLKTHQRATGNELSSYLGVSRQALNKHLKKLINSGIVTKTGATKNAVYEYGSFSSQQTVKELTYKKEYQLPGLEEDKVFGDVALILNLKKRVNEKTANIIRYAFTELLNNAIEHSESDRCIVEILMDQYNFQFAIRDFGIGVFYSIYTKFNLSDENAAVGELIKGKTTTMQARHSGEGIFFTSKSADMMQLRSHNIHLVFDNKKKDVFLNEKKSIKGTEVTFTISKNSKRKLTDIFARFAPEEFDYRFDKTKVAVKLFQEAYISRSEAKRLLFGMDKFKEIVLDFRGVKSIGQGFADEIFRVFSNQHPDITIKTENLSDILKTMIKHVQEVR